jgi:3-hydroxyacyl-CoA dehydrogenase
VLAGAKLSPEDALILERSTFDQLRQSKQSKALRHIFFAERSVSKMPALKSVKPRIDDAVGVVGGGTMGAGIAAAVLLSGRHVTMIERDTAALDNGLASVRSILAGSLRRGLISSEKHKKINANLRGNTDFAALNTADVVIEAVFEDLSVKIDVFRKLGEVVRSDAVLASNTSYLDINKLAGGTRDPSRIVGLHFFSPAHIMKLVEVIHTDYVAPDALATALSLAKGLGKIAVPSGVCDGFIGNRIMSAYRLVGETLLEDGALPHQIDSAMRDFGMPMGLFEMQDLAGLDIGYAMRQRRATTRDPNQRYVDIPDKLFERNRLGRKSGSGYYLYGDSKTPERDAAVEALIEQESARKGIIRQAFSSAQIMDKLLVAMRSEANEIISEGIAATADAVDVVMVHGYGYPRWRGGPMFDDPDRS